MTRPAPRDHSSRQSASTAEYTERVHILTLFGFASVSLMLLAYACEERAPAFVLLFAGACCASSIYGFLTLQLALREDGTWIEMGGSAAIKDFLRDEFKVLATA